MNKLIRWDYWTDIDGTEQWGSDIQGRWCKAEDVERLETINAELLEALEYIANVNNYIPNHGDAELPDALFVAMSVAHNAIAKAKGTNV